jgi:hypothetical protein
MKMLFPVILAILGLIGGVAAGHFMKPPPALAAMAAGGHGASEPVLAADSGSDHGGGHNTPTPEDPSSIPTADDHNPADDAKYEYVVLDKQFVVPLVNESRVHAMIILSLSVEATVDGVDFVHRRSPKLRDVFLQVLFRHAHSGGFNGVFTGGQAMADLRAGLRDAAKGVLGETVHDVLVTDIVRQDM